MRELHSLENLAHCDTVCLDKTGTLTEGRLSVEKVFTDIDDRKFEKLMTSYIRNTDDNNSTFIALKNCSFLQTAVRAALPNGIAVFVCCALLFVLSERAGIAALKAHF